MVSSAAQPVAESDHGEVFGVLDVFPIAVAHTPDNLPMATKQLGEWVVVPSLEIDLTVGHRCDAKSHIDPGSADLRRAGMRGRGRRPQPNSHELGGSAHADLPSPVA